MKGNQDNVNYVLLTQDILQDKNLKTADKIVLARISGFKEFFESAQKTAEFCGLSERTVKSAKQRLLKNGYLIELTNTGHGKKYAADVQKLHTRCAESVQQKCKKCQSEVQIEAPYTKDILKKKEYGDSEVNEFLESWKNATGNDFKKSKRERRAAYNLIKSQTKEGLEGIIKAVERIHRSHDRFAPSIAAPSDLVGEFTKLPKLRLWTAKNEPVKAKSTLVLDYDGLPPAYEVTETERAKIKEQIKSMRESGNLPWN